MKKALDWLQEFGRPRRCALIFSLADQYQDFVKEMGGWEKAAAHYLPHVYESHLKDRRVTLHAIAAVANTRTVLQPKGHTERMPAPG